MKKDNRNTFSLIDVCFYKLHVLIEFEMDSIRKKNNSYLSFQVHQLK